MNPEQENFESLRRLLVLKRYEQPPPGYFEECSRQIHCRLRAGGRAEAASGLERLLWEAPWLQRFWAALEGNPYVAGAFGVGVCGMLLGAVLWAERVDNQPFAFPGSDAAPVAMETRPAVDPVFARASLGGSTGGFVPQQPRNSIFQDLQQLRQTQPAMPVNFAVPSSN